MKAISRARLLGLALIEAIVAPFRREALPPLAGAAVQHGKDAEFKLKDNGGVLRDLTGFVSTAGLARSVETAETTTLANDDKTYLAGLRDATVPVEGNWDPTVDGYLVGLLGAAEQDFEFYPQGNTSGKVKYTGKALLTSYESSTDVGDAGRVSGELQCSGAITRSLVP